MSLDPWVMISLLYHRLMVLRCHGALTLHVDHVDPFNLVTIFGFRVDSSDVTVNSDDYGYTIEPS